LLHVVYLLLCIIYLLWYYPSLYGTPSIPQ
jgi:hypothetical protein